mmetsp:Transcript_86773/g.163656  ORF Transcript_86773/g.163656 Transcript_86773/m.163656 type:complete len:229 (+) Transcript_86773:79-765(+)
MPRAEELEDPEEAAAWAALQAAFGEPGTAAAAAESSAATSGEGDGGVKRSDEASQSLPSAKRAKVTAAPKAKASSNGFSSAAMGNGSSQPLAGEDAGDTWLQSEVDRLVGEVQRLADGPFSFQLLKDLWSASLEDQHEVLLGAIGSAGEHIESKQERAKTLWKLIGEEVRARRDGEAEAPPPKIKIPAGKAPPSAKAAVAKRPPAPKSGARPAGGKAAGRGRDRSPSI